MRNLVFIIFLFFSTDLLAQNPSILTYQQVVAMALESNYEIQIAQNNKRIATKQNTLGNAGFLPKIDVLSSGNLATNNTN